MDDDEVQAYVIISDARRKGVIEALNRWAKLGYRLHTVRGDWYIMEHLSMRVGES